MTRTRHTEEQIIAVLKDGDVGVVITETALSFCRRGSREPVSLVGAGVDTILRYTGPITKALFGFARN